MGPTSMGSTICQTMPPSSMLKIQLTCIIAASNIQEYFIISCFDSNYSWLYARVLSSDASTIDLAVQTAENVFQSGVWSKSDVRYRAQIMNAIAMALRADLNRLAEMEVAQTGRSVR